MDHDTPVRNMRSLGHEINSYWIWVSVDEHGEGVIAATVGRENFPLVAATLDTAIAMSRLVEQVVASTGRKARLLRFDQRTVVRELTPH